MNYVDYLFQFFKVKNDDKLSEDLRKFLDFAKEYNQKKSEEDDRKN